MIINHLSMYFVTFEIKQNSFPVTCLSKYYVHQILFYNYDRALAYLNTKMSREV